MERNRGEVYSRVAKRIYSRSASRAGGRDSMHNAINTYFGNSGGGDRSGAGAGRSKKGSCSGYGGRDLGRDRSGNDDRPRKPRSSSRRRRSSGRHRPPRGSALNSQATATATATAIGLGCAAGLTGLTSLSESLPGQIPGPPTVPLHISAEVVVPLVESHVPPPAPPPPPPLLEALETPEKAVVGADRVSRKTGTRVGAGVKQRSSRARSMRTLANNRGFDSSSESDSGSFIRCYDGMCV